MSEEFNNNNEHNSEENPQVKKTVKKIVKKRNVSQYASGTPAQSGYGGYGGGYGGYGYGGYGGYGYGGYGGGYGGYGYGYGQQQGQPHVANRTIGDYLHILRERIWFIIITFVIIVAAVTIYSIRMEPIYASTATVRILRDVDNPVKDASQRTDSQVRNTEDLNTQVHLLRSYEVVNAVKKQLRDDDKARLMAPYRDIFTFGTKKSEDQVLTENRTIYPDRMSLIVNIRFWHPDRDLAAKIANLYATEFISYSQQTNASELLTMIQNLQERVKAQDAKVKDLETRLVDFRKTNDGISLDQRLDLMATELNMLTTSLTNAKQNLDAAQTNWRMIQEYRQDGKNLWNIPFIAANPRVSQLLPQRSSLMITMATLEKRYKAKHPAMVELTRQMEELEKELTGALDSAAAEAKAIFDTAQENYAQIQKNLEEKKQERSVLSQKAVEYKAIEREKIAAEQLHYELASQMNKRLAEVSLIPPSARQIDYASRASEPSSPNHLFNIGVGVAVAFVVSIIVAFLVAFIDDRVKSAHDIEAVIGLPLLGAIPRVKRLSSSEKAQVSASNADRGATEAFRSILSSIKLSHVGKNAKIILSTSTTPSEGKSFVLSNIAFTSAIHGEKVLVIDADLRLPAIAKVLGIEVDKGLVAYTEGRASFDECVVREYFPNMDILPCEKRVSTPTQILNGDAFISLLQDLRSQYDKIYIDTPPIGAVSDAISLLPYVDGIIYVIKYNAIKRKVIKGYVKKLLDSNVPILGAVMNMVNSSTSQAYTSNYYNKSYKNYYLADDEELEEEKSEGNPPRAS